MKPSGISLGGYRPGANGRVTEFHGRYYHRHWGFGLYFESKVAAGLDAARHFYQKYGFTLTGEHEARQWGGPVLEQRFQWRP